MSGTLTLLALRRTPQFLLNGVFMKGSCAAAVHDAHGALMPTDGTLHPRALGAPARQRQLFGARLAAR